MAKIAARFDANQFRRQLDREAKRFARQGIQGMTRTERVEIGESMIEVMKDQIAKGISPIDGWGRFPAYKWVARAGQLMKNRRLLKNKQARRSLRKSAKLLKETKYPASVRKKFPNKRERPVNLFLSGNFLDAIEARASAVGLFIGIYKQPYVKYEEGHRTGGVSGVNDQPKRPIIPINRETFTRVIYRRLLDQVRKVLTRRLERQSPSR